MHVAQAHPDSQRGDDGQGARLLRHFVVYAIASVMFIVALFAGGASLTFTRHMVREAEADAVSIGTTVLEHEIEPYLHAAPHEKADIVLNDEAVNVIDARVHKVLPFLGVLKVKIYNADGRIVYSNDRNIVGVVDSANKKLSRALAGEIVSSLESKDTLWDIAGERKIDLDMVEAYLPLRDPRGAIAGVYELYMDVSHYRSWIRSQLAASIVVVVLVLLVVFSAFFVLMWRARGIIRAKAREIRVLQGMLPICSFCKRIRDDAGEWHQFEAYISQRSGTTFTHGVCPECVKREYPELGRHGRA